MRSRRELLVLAAAAVLAPPVACTELEMDDYEQTAARLRAPVSMPADFEAFVRFATLAPSGHNTQPWRFAARADGASILPDLSRRTPVVDPDDHHLFVSLGAAVENFLIAAGANGRPGAAHFSDGSEARIDIDLAQGPARDDALYRAIPARQSTRSNYDGRAVAAHDLKRLEAAAGVEGVSVILITDPSGREAVLDHLIRGNNYQMDDPAFVKELRDWIRFNPAQALETGDGLFSKCSGGPTLPTWIGRPLFGLFFKKDAENAKYTEQMRSSAGVAVFVGDKEDKEHWFKVGRSFQRFALQATALGIRLALINQPVEAPSIRADFARWLGVADMRPDLVVRFGAAPAMPMSMRRPVSAVIMAPT
jgi:nitroreductase